MKRSRLIFSGLISVVILLGYSSCEAQEKVTCKASIVYHGQEITGRMMFKQASPDTVRFALFNELGMSFVEGSVSVGSWQLAVGSKMEISKIAAFLDRKSFTRNLERGLKELIIDKETGDVLLPEAPKEMVYRRGNKFIFKLVL